ncbi:MAG: hypothetical protein ABI639_02550 [Thermoanaerobaculia bacterium]
MTPRRLGWICALAVFAFGCADSGFAQTSANASGSTAEDGNAAGDPADSTPVPLEDGNALKVKFGIEGKANYRDSQHLAVVSPFPFPPDFLPPGATRSFLETANEGQHLEISTFTLYATASWGSSVEAHAKVDFIDLYDRNPTSSDKKVDVDELWIRFGQDPTTTLPESFGLYAKVGKFAHFERQNDRHTESYGLISTAFNRFEDQGLEVGAAFGKHFYLKGSLTQGNPLFFRDPNALAADNGSPDRDPSVQPNPDPTILSGFPIFYDAEVEDLDVDGDLEVGAGLGLRFGEPGSGHEINFLAWGYKRKLATSVKLEGTFYGGDLDLLNGPFDSFSLPIHGDKKQEVGANLWIYEGSLTFFGQYVAQELAGMDRTGYEGEFAWKFELPLAWATAGRQLFPYVQPVVRYSFLKPEFQGGSPSYPAPSVRWEWTKIDYGVRLGLIEGVDLTVEYADNEMTLANGRKVSNDELLGTLRFKM